MMSKAKLNSIYGMSVQSPVKQNIDYIDDIFEIAGEDERELLENVFANDEMYLLRDVTSFGVCTVHEEAVAPEFDPNDPSTWFPWYDPTDPFAPLFPNDEETEDQEQEEKPESWIPSLDIFNW